MSLKTHFSILILLVLGFSCSEQQKEAPDTTKEEKPQNEGHFLTSSEGDTILSGMPIPVEGKRIHPDSVARPKTVPLYGAPKVVPAHTNVYPVGRPKTVKVPERLKIFTPGKDGAPLPKTVPARGKVMTVKQPPSAPALPPRFKDAAITDIRCLDVDEGMISSNVSSMLEDRHGHLWFGTRTGGVSRYDGNRFTHYTTEEGLSNNVVMCMLEDSRGHLWFGTQGGGLNCYDGSRFIHYTTKEGLNHDNVSAILEDSRGRLWFGTWGGGVSCLDSSRFIQYTAKQGLSNDFIRCILEDSQGNLWFGTWQGGLNRYDGASFTHYTTAEGLSSNSVQSILEDSQGQLWFGTWRGGLSRYDGRHFAHYTTEEGLSGNTVMCMLEDNRGHLWFGTREGGVSRYDPAEAKITHFTTDEGLSGDYVQSILEDSEGHLWFGTWGNGVNRYNGGQFAYYTTKEGLSDNSVWCMQEGRHGQLWFGTMNGGLNCYDGNHFIHYTSREGFTARSAVTMTEDKRGTLWLGTIYDGVIRYDPDKGGITRYTTAEGLNLNACGSSLEDRQGRLWFGNANGLVRYDLTENGIDGYFTHYNTAGSYNNVGVLLEDSRGHLWLGHDGGGGVSCFEPAADGIGGTLTRFTTGEGLSNNRVMSIMEDSQGFLWFGTLGGGVNRYDPADGKITHYGAKEGLASNYVVSILEDYNKNIWIGADNGITLLVPRPGGPSTNTGSEAGGYQFFTLGKDDGFKNTTFVYNSVCLDRSNRIWWGAMDGLTMLDLNHFELPAEPPRARLNAIEVNQAFVDFQRLSDTSYLNAFSFGEELLHSFDSVVPFYNYPAYMELPYNLNHLTFHFSAIDWAAPHKIKYSYFIEGLDKTWSTPTAESKADYRNLPYGDFTLKVRAIGAAQVWSEPFEYAFSIRPPWWHTWWAYGLYIAFAFIVIIGAYRFQLNRKLAAAETKRVKELDAVKTKLYTNITHEFRTPLTIILGIADQLKSQARQSIRPGLDMIIRNGQSLLTLVNQMLDLSKLESGTMPLHLQQGDVVNFLQYVAESFHSYAGAKDIRLHFLSQEKELMMDYAPEKLLHIISNLLSNAIKFTPEGGDVYLVVEGNQRTVDSRRQTALQLLIIKVKDTGIGIPADELPYIFDRFFQAHPPPSPPKGRGFRNSSPLGGYGSATSSIR